MTITILVGVVAFLAGLALRRRAPSPPAVAAALESSVKSGATRLLDTAVESVRAGFLAERVVLWQVSTDGQHAVPWIVRGGLFPRAVLLAGDVLGWAAQQGIALRSETAPLWSEDECKAAGVASIPVSLGGALLSAEFNDARALPAVADLERAAAYLASFIDHEQERAAGLELRNRVEAMMQMLRRLPAEIDPVRLAEQLAQSAMELTDAEGAAVIEWEADGGKLSVLLGHAGLEPGTVIVPQESESAIAARSGATIARNGRRRGATPLIAAGESFGVQPRAFAAIPLNAAGNVIAVLTIWTGKDQLNAEGVTSLEALAPYAALQFRHAQDFGRMRDRADHDRLTGLYNRQAFDSLLGAETARFQRYAHPFSVLLMDLDHFKAINDRYGHPAGDAVLAAVGAVLSKTLRTVDIAARYGGEEFAVILPETDLAMAHEIAERVRSAVGALSVSTSAGHLNLTVSVGVSACPENAGDGERLVRTADAALYVSKGAGRNRVSAAPPARQ